MADAWYQTAGEVKALYHQGYNIGKMKLDAVLAKGTEKKAAIVLNLDETVLDNSSYQAMTVKEKKGVLGNGMSGFDKRKQRLFLVPFLFYDMQMKKVYRFTTFPIVNKIS